MKFRDISIKYMKKCEIFRDNRLIKAACVQILHISHCKNTYQTKDLKFLRPLKFFASDFNF